MKLSNYIVFPWIMTLASCQQNIDQNITKKIVGSWALIKCVATDQDGKTSFPFGEKPRGRITYDAHGKMIVVITHEGAQKFKSQHPFQGTPDEIIPAYNGMIAYFGTYTIDPDSSIIIHSIEASSFPNWVGQEQKRRYKLTSDTLILRTPLISAIQYEMTWKIN